MHEYFHLPQPAFHETMGNNPVLDKARALQNTLRHDYYDDPIDAQRAPLEQLRRLHTEAMEANMWQQPVQLTGVNVVVPRLSINTESGLQAIESQLIEEVPTHCIGGQGPIEGWFYGFIPSVRYDNQEERYFADLQYQIITQKNVALNTVCGELCAHGSVDTTNLTFHADTRNTQYIEAFNTLVDTANSTHTALATMHLGRLLSVSDTETLYNASRVRAIGKAVRLLERHRGYVDMRCRDAEIDMLAAKFDIGFGGDSAFAVHTLLAHIRKNGQNSLTSDPLMTGRLVVSGLSFVPHTAITPEEIMIAPSEDTIALAAHASTEETEYYSLHIPLEKIQALHPAAQE